MQTYLTSSKQHSDLTDEVLVQQAQSGDQGAFEMLVDRYSASLLPRQSYRHKHGETIGYYLCFTMLMPKPKIDQAQVFQESAAA